MNPQIASGWRRSVARTRNRITLRLSRLWTTAALAVREFPWYLLVTVHRLRRESSPTRWVVLAGVSALVITPTVMYRAERDERLAQKHAYQSLQLESAVENSFLESSVQELVAEQAVLRNMLLDAGHAVRQGPNVTVKVVATGYSSSVQETDDTPFITAANTPTRWGIMAMSRDLIDRYTPGAPFSFGDQVHVPGLGDFLVEDTMNARWTNRIDIWFPSRLEALRFGVREVYVTKVQEDAVKPGPDGERAEATNAAPPSGAGF